jgi:hypothetical protein
MNGKIMAILIGAATVSFCATSGGQQASTPQSILAAALAAMNASSVQSLSLSGNAEYIAGSTDETGSFTGQCAVNGASQFQLQTPAVSLTENRQIANGVPSGNWVDTDGQQHTMAGQNLFTPESWFCAPIALLRFVQSTVGNTQFVGNETKNGIAVAHFTIITPAASTTPESALTAHLTQSDLFLNSQTLVPVALDFNIHPDSDALIDIPVEILYSNYAVKNGALIPTTIQRYVNSTLALTLQVQSATITPAPTTSISQ